MGGVGSGLCASVGEGGGLSSYMETAKAKSVVTVIIRHHLNKLIVSFHVIGPTAKVTAIQTSI